MALRERFTVIHLPLACVKEAHLQYPTVDLEPCVG